MIIGIPKEIKIRENRVAGTPEAARTLVQEGHKVLVQRSAGVGSGFLDEEYEKAGATLTTDIRSLYDKADLIWKVKEPTPQEIHLYRKGQLLFTFLHLAASATLTRDLCNTGLTGIAYETVEGPDHTLPLLAPMSEAAGKLATVIGANYLRKDLGGKGVLLSGIQGRSLGRVTILGVGTVGYNSLLMAHGLGAEVTVIDINEKRLEGIRREFPQRLTTSLSDPKMIAASVRDADLVIGAVLVPGKRPPTLVTEAMVRTMQPGSVIVDVAVDQGGCIETTRPTHLDDPIYKVHEVLHYAVTNMPALVPRSATLALSAATLPYLRSIARKGLETASREDPGLKKGIAIQFPIPAGWS